MLDKDTHSRDSKIIIHLIFTFPRIVIGWTQQVLLFQTCTLRPTVRLKCVGLHLRDLQNKLQFNGLRSKLRINITQGSHIDEDSRFQGYDTMSISKEEFIASILHLYTLQHKQKPKADVQKQF